MTLAQARKAALSLIAFGVAAAALFITVDPGLNTALISLTGAAFATVGVFLAKNHTYDDLSKAVAQLQGAALTAVGIFVTVPTTTVEKISVLIAAALSVYGVYRIPNEPV